MTASAPMLCAGCGTEGRAATIIWDKSAPQDPRPVLAPVFGWHDDGRPALLCPACRKRLERRKRRRARP